ncbi:hypothetical protein O3M35_004062 [Rhynocoris fuscipes]|uniref:C-1-tetrahydrofolate synthase, cytoplasmic n=1 Tax=Rhynocoris fuscipes TaxID=488301 RepID=A0AAW1CL33_9HEMI
MNCEKVAELISGTAVAKELQAKLKDEVKQMSEVIPDFRPGLAIVQVGGREDSNVYIRMKMKSAEEIGINAVHYKLPSHITQIQLLNHLKNLNNDPSVHGIIVQMPLDTTSDIDSHLITDSVSPEKDVDGLNTINEGRVAVGDMTGFVPCTPHGVIELIKRTNIPIAGSNSVVLGRSKIVGTPVAELLKWHHATVTVCHSRTKDIQHQVSLADILVVGIGKAEFVKGSWIKKGAVVIDCGINAIPDPSKKSGKRIVGDVEFSTAKLAASYITPVPGGVGPMTVAMLMKNTVISAQRAFQKLINPTWQLASLPISPIRPVPSDCEIARSQTPKDITDLAGEIGISLSEISCYGTTKAKISLKILQRLNKRPNGKLVVISGITPTPFGEGKSTTTVGLVQALSVQKGVNSFACLRQPSQGPLFGIKGGAAGGGYSQIIPMDDFNLHLTGDIHAVTAANNLLAAQIDARIFHEATQTDKALYDRLVPNIDGCRKFSACQLRRLKKLGINCMNPDMITDDEKSKFVRLNIDADTISWTRVIDTNDRFLREITIGESPTEKGMIRKTSFSISVASEIMAVLALAKDLGDLKDRLGRIVVAFNKQGEPITADDLGATGAMAVLLKDAIEPTLMQTLEGTPALVHTGPFANIAHGCSSVVADLIALKLVGENGYVVTESGFGSDIGLEKFIGIKCRILDQAPNAVVLVATVRALKMHGGGPTVVPGKPLHKQYLEENLDLLKKGLCNLQKHISNCIQYGLAVIVAINAFNTDTNNEFELIKKVSLESGAKAAVVATNWADGSSGAVALADAVIAACNESTVSLRHLYDLNLPLLSKAEIIAKKIYGASKIVLDDAVMKKIQKLEERGFSNLPVCMSKTALSLSGDANIKGAPEKFDLPLTDVYLSAGAGFVVFMVGEVSKMPGLPTRPCIYDIDLDIETGTIQGLF